MPLYVEFTLKGSKENTTKVVDNLKLVSHLAIMGEATQKNAPTGAANKEARGLLARAW